MVYFMSDVHGAVDAYFSLKERVKFSKDDTMYIVGDILDGDNKKPENCLRILDDVMNNKNIHLLLGNHEFAHIQFYLSYKDNDKEGMNMWREYLVNPVCGGGPLLNYMTRMDKSDYHRYMEYLSTQCEFYFYGPVGNINVFAIHGAPVSPTEDESNTVYDALSTQIYFDQPELHKNIAAMLRCFETDQRKQILNKENLLVIAGHVPAKYLIEGNPGLSAKMLFREQPATPTQYVILHNDVLCLDCGCRANTLGKKNSSDGWKSNLSIARIDNTGVHVGYHIP